MGRAWAVAALALSSDAAPAQQAIGVVKVAEGAVTLRRAGAARAVAAGDDLAAGDVVETGAAGAFGAILADGATLSMGARSQASVETFRFEPSAGLYALVMRVFFGRFVYGSGRIGETAPDRVRLETPQMTIATRGTRFAVLVPRP